MGLIPDVVDQCVSSVPQQSHYDLFCDGTGKDPACPPCRLLAWNVILAGRDLQHNHVPIAWGGLPGYWQTVIRGELTAFVAALIFGRRTGALCHLVGLCHGD